MPASVHCISSRPMLVRATLIVLSSAAACGSGDRTVERAPSAGTNATAAQSAPAATDSMRGMGMAKGAGTMAGMGKTTGDADHDFLRMMSDHHKGLIALAHMTKERSDVGAAKGDATTLDAEQDKEIDVMQTMLEKDFKDPYTPKVAAEHKAMAEGLKERKGAVYERAFYQDVVTHHQEAIAMIDAYLPTGRSAAIKQMAARMKTVQTREIADFQRKAGRIR